MKKMVEVKESGGGGERLMERVSERRMERAKRDFCELRVSEGKRERKCELALGSLSGG